jgi:sugar O-acyltransferase (sialic acid O-acetyltransferase NeuD family)
MGRQMRPLLLVGSGGFGRETAEAVLAVNDVAPQWDLLGFLDDDPARTGSRPVGVPVVGPIDAVHEHPDALVVLCTGRPDNYVSRLRIAQRLGLEPERYATVVHPSVAASRSSTVGPGSVLLAHTVLTADVTVGAHVAVMPQTVLTHDTVVGDWATIASGVRLGGAVRIEPGAYVGSSVTIRQGLTVGAWAMVGMAAVVTRDVPAGRLWFGAPARDHGGAPLPAGFLADRLAGAAP